ncbi:MULTISPECIES: nitronate monooxygenase [unclassified Amycolatopsis]|uniref:NAD(P)H-dependent flavin oxidoreductase n=1 Tax=unclassified Amycolatopsis TaxID=2618356 RepID=UPI0034521917
MRTALTDLVGVRHPVVQTGMGWVAGPRLVSATAEAGGLGILASATMTYDELATAIKETRARTENPFGVNLRADAEDATRRVDLLITEGVKVASFALAPNRELITKLKDHGVVVLPSVGAARHAEKVADWGADAVVVQGGEGGGHTGGVATTLLLPAVLDAVDIPVVAAGGFFDGRGLAAALAYGAAGIAMGTRFLLTRESTVPDAVKQLYLDHDLAGTVVTRKVDGLPHRVLRTGLVDALEKSGPLAGFARAAANAARFRRSSGLSWAALVREGLRLRTSGRTRAQVLMAANTPMLLRAGLVDGDPAAGVLASGQVVGLLRDLPSVADLIEGIVADAEAILRRLGDGRCA